jgi:hypothetical protein
MFNPIRTVVADTGDEVTIDTGPCPFCKKPGTVVMPKAAWLAWDDGRGPFIQRVWPQGSAGDREQLINGVHGACFDKVFPEEEP